MEVHYTIGGRLIRWRWQDGLERERLGQGPLSIYFEMPVIGGDEETKNWARVLLIRKARKERKYVFIRKVDKLQPRGQIQPIICFSK